MAQHEKRRIVHSKQHDGVDLFQQAVRMFADGQPQRKQADRKQGSKFTSKEDGR